MSYLITKEELKKRLFHEADAIQRLRSGDYIIFKLILSHIQIFEVHVRFQDGKMFERNHDKEITLDDIDQLWNHIEEIGKKEEVATLNLKYDLEMLMYFHFNDPGDRFDKHAGDIEDILELIKERFNDNI